MGEKQCGLHPSEISADQDLHCCADSVFSSDFELDTSRFESSKIIDECKMVPAVPSIPGCRGFTTQGISQQNAENCTGFPAPYCCFKNLSRGSNSGKNNFLLI